MPIDLGVPAWGVPSDGSPVHTYRDAEHWSASGDEVQCTLCYRDCVLSDGEVGTCGFRANEGGKMVLKSHGIISSSVRQIRGFQVDPFLTYKPGQTSVFYGGIQCTAACTFCMSAQIVHRPESLDWVVDQSKTAPAGSLWYGVKAYLHPATAVLNAQAVGASSITLGINEPTLSFEWTLDVARLAKMLKLDVVLETNGFTGPAAIDQLAPYIDAVDVGVKGSADPKFYAKVMRSPDAVPRVFESISRWRANGVHTIVGDLIATPRMQDDDRFEKYAKRFYAEILERCGPVTAVLITGMAAPGPQPEVARSSPMDGASDDRVRRALELAKEAGLPFAHGKESPDQSIDCPECGGVLLALHERCGPSLIARGQDPDTTCLMAQHFCPFWRHEQYVTDSKCDHCGTPVPIVTLSPAELAEEQAFVSSPTR